MKIESDDSGLGGIGCLLVPILGLMTVYALYGVFEGYLIIPSRRGEASTYEGIEARLGGISFFALCFAFVYYSFDASAGWRGLKNLYIGSFAFGLVVYLLIKIFLD